MWSVGSDKNTPLRVLVAVLALLVVVVAVTISKRKPVSVASDEDIAAATSGGATPGDGSADASEDAEAAKV
jgi:K(+)-stimulated pyrophosphate-energized sodium pump